VSKQLTLALRAPAEHVDFVHTEQRLGTILVWKQQSSSRQWIKVQPTDDLALLMAEHLGQNDRYFRSCNAPNAISTKTSKHLAQGERGTDTGSDAIERIVVTVLFVRFGSVA